MTIMLQHSPQKKNNQHIGGPQLQTNGGSQFTPGKAKNQMKNTLIRVLTDLAADDFVDGRYYELKAISEKFIQSEPTFAENIKKFTEERASNGNNRTWPFAMAWKETLSNKKISTAHRFFTFTDEVPFLKCPQNLVKVSARGFEKYKNLEFDPDQVIGSSKSKNGKESANINEEETDEQDDPVENFVQSTLENNLAMLQSGSQIQSQSQSQSKQSCPQSAQSQVQQSQPLAQTQPETGPQSQSLPQVEPLDFNLNFSASQTNPFSFRPTSASEPAQGSDPFLSLRKRKNVDADNQTTKTRKVTDDDAVSMSSLMALLDQQTKNISTTLAGNMKQTAINMVTDYHKTVAEPAFQGLKIDLKKVDDRVSTVEMDVEKLKTHNTNMESRFVEIVEEKWSSYEPNSVDEVAVSDNIKYASYLRKRKAFMNIIQSVIELAILRVDFNDHYTSRDMAQTGAAAYSIKHDILGTYFKTKYEVKATWVRFDEKKTPKGLSARIQLKDGPTASRAVWAVDAVKRRKDSNGLGVNFVMADEYDCNEEFFEWKSKGIIKNFSLTKDARYVLVVEEGKVCSPGCPLEFVKLCDADPNVLKQNLLKLADFTSHFPHNGRVLNVPDKYVARYKAKDMRKELAAKNAQQANVGNFGVGTGYVKKGQKPMPPINIKGFTQVSGGASSFLDRGTSASQDGEGMSGGG